MNTTFLLFLIGLSLISILIIFGFMLSKFTKENSLFKNIAIVIIAITATFALVQSNFRSYLLIAFILLIYALFRDKLFNKQISFTKQKLEHSFVKTLVLGLFYFSISFVVLNLQLLTENNVYSSLHPDFSFYAAVSEILTTTGIENSDLSSALSGKLSYQFYHYFELWFNGLITIIINNTFLNTLMFVTIPCFSAIMLLGIYELQQKIFGQVKLLSSVIKYFIPLMILFVFPFMRTFSALVKYIAGENLGYWTNPSIASGIALKLIIVVSGITYLLLDYVKNKNKNIILICAFIGIVYPPTLVTIIPSIMIWQIFIIKQINKKIIFDNFILFISIGLVFLWINSFEKGSIDNNVYDIPSTIEMIQTHFGSNIKKYLMYVISPLLTFIKLSFYVSPILILLFLKRKSLVNILKTKKDLIFLFTLFFVISSYGAGLLGYHKDGVQLYENIMLPIYILCIFLAFIYLISSKKTYIKVFTTIVLSLMLIINIYGFLGRRFSNNPEDNKVSNVNNIIDAYKKSSSKESIMIASNDFYSDMRSKNTKFIIAGHNLRFFVNGYFPHTLSLDKIKMESMAEKAYLAKNLIRSKYFNEIIQQELSYKEVIKSNKEITFLIIDKEALENINAESEFSADYLGVIDGFSYYKRR
ncbi:hypothetical protein K8354_09675 [Polaribacter litorisediminis]|uniref:hypothetical protein n=1 Tax=Polaribacter litorisediminis TaxID=1908341 RepID=UPI001CC0E771|nr:hypothetical protein [Polaribacter litorisediminis]UAM96611.1 hypothetical protein K8354_09675 [Polaribacter litorisediminis]